MSEFREACKELQDLLSEEDKAALSQVPAPCDCSEGTSASPCSADLRVCERAETCSMLNSDGEPCRHGMPHKWDQGCEIGCRSKLPFGAVCVPVKEAQAERR